MNILWLMRWTNSENVILKYKCRHDMLMFDYLFSFSSYSYVQNTVKVINSQIWWIISHSFVFSDFYWFASFFVLILLFTSYFDSFVSKMLLLFNSYLDIFQRVLSIFTGEIWFIFQIFTNILKLIPSTYKSG